MVRRLVFFFALAIGSAAHAAEGPVSPPVELADRFSVQMLAAARRANAHAVRVDLQGDPSLDGAPALVAISRELESALFGAGKLTPAGGPATADLEIVATLSRVRGRVALGGAVTARGAALDWVIASDQEGPEWWPWLAPVRAGPPAASGFVWRRAGSLPGVVEDADAGDVDGDGVADFAVLTGAELLIFRAGEAAPELMGKIAVDDAAEAADVATRAPRGFVRVAATAAGAEVLVRRTDEKKTRVYGWESGKLARRADRDGLVVAARLTARGADVVSAEPAPGTNRFTGPPKIRRASGAARAMDDVAWVDFRPASLTAVAAVSETTAQYGWLDATAVLHLLRADGGEAARVAHCGSAFALADLDGDALPDAICSADGAAANDKLTVYLSSANLASASWSTPLDGGALAVAAAPLPSGAALADARSGTPAPLLRSAAVGTPASAGALVFVGGASGESEVWMLRSAR